MLKKTINTIVFLCLCYINFAQNLPNLLLSKIDEENGLSDNHITAVLKDRQGFVWIGTTDGMNVLDGSTIKIYKHKQADNTTITDNKINEIQDDTNGNVWIATDNGLSKFEKQTGLFKNYYLSSCRYGNSNIIFSIAIKEKNIWCATDAGLVKFNIQNGVSTYYECNTADHKVYSRLCNKTQHVVIDENNICWLCTSDGVWSFDTKSNLFKRAISSENDPLYNPLFLTAFSENETNLWVGNWQYGLKLYNKKTGTVTNFKNAGLCPNNVCSIKKISQPDGSNFLWLNGNLIAFNTTTKEFLQFKKPLQFLDYPNSKNIYAAKDNSVWIGTDNGLYIYTPQRQNFNTHLLGATYTTQNIVFNSFKDQIILGAQGDNIFNIYDNSFKRISKQNSFLFSNYLYKEKDAAALSITLQSNNEWWITTSEGIVKFDLTTKQKTWYEHKANDTTSLPKNFINYVFFDSKKRLWIFPWRNGIWQMDKTTGKCKQLFTGFGTIAGIKKQLLIADAVEDDAGNIWFADLDEGIVLYEQKTGTFSKPFENTIGNPHTNRLYKKGNNIYSVANNTIIKWKDKSGCVKINLPQELEKKVYDFAPDKNGNWWLVTVNGLLFFNEQLQFFKRFTIADGLYSNDLDGTIFCMPDGKMLIGMPSFITSFLPENVTAVNKNKAAVTLIKFTANGTTVDVDSTQNIQLNYTQNNIIVEWALPDFTNPFKNQYYCQLVGIDSVKNYIGNKGIVQYAKLSYGHYTLLLSAANANGEFSTKVLLIHFTIEPPFWKTTWFIVLSILFLGIAVYCIFKTKINKVRKKALLKQQMAELEMKALRAQMNPHFIFNSLNAIQECIVMNNSHAAYDYLSKFSKMVRRILENSGKLYVTLKEEIELLQWYVQLEQLRFKEPVDFDLIIENVIDIENISIPSMIIQPYVENALWHGLAMKTINKKLTIRFIKKQHGIECIILDNGIGRENADMQKKKDLYKKSMGMMITKERLQLFNTKAKVEIQDLFDADNIATGTIIIIYLPTE